MNLSEQLDVIRGMLWEYTLNIEQRYVNEIIQLDNNINFRYADDIDLLSKIQARARLEAVRDVCNDIQTILKIGR